MSIPGYLLSQLTPKVSIDPLLATADLDAILTPTLDPVLRLSSLRSTFAGVRREGVEARASLVCPRRQQWIEALGRVLREGWRYDVELSMSAVSDDFKSGSRTYQCPWPLELQPFQQFQF